MRKTLNDRGVAALKPKAERYAHPDPECAGLFIRVQPSGSRSFAVIARSPAGRQIWTTLGAADTMPIAEAREAARKVAKRIRTGLPAVEVAPDSVADVVADWLVRHVEARGLRSSLEIRRLIDAHILPAWSDRDFTSIKRSDVSKLLDHIEDKHGARTADRILTTFSSIANWYESRNDSYTKPLARGMRRQSTAEQARDRILNDDEIRIVWKTAEAGGAFGAIVRLALLTAQRRTKIAEMKWTDVDVSGVWTIPRAPREKENAGALLLPEAALEIIRAQPRVGANPHVFPARGSLGAFNGFSKSKKLFDAKLPADMDDYVLHDLRRTARSLMSRADIRPDVAERVLGHVIGGVAGTYDRFSYDDAKRDALARLATLIRSIVDPPAPNVIPMPKKRKAPRAA